MMRRRQLRRLVAGLLGLGLPLAIGEIVVRASGLAPRLLEQPWFSHIPGPLPHITTPGYHLSGPNRTGEFEMDAVVNSRGFLDDEWETAKTPGRRRIIFLGDSFTASVARKDAVRYVDDVERQLAEAVGPDRVEVINMGVGGYWAQPERILLEEQGLALEPDAVVVNFLSNDVLDTHHGIEAVRLGPSHLLRDKHETALGFWTPLYLRSHLARWVLKILVIDPLPWDAEPDDFDEVYRLEEGRYAEDWQAILDEYRIIKQHCDRRGIPLFLVYHCLPPSWESSYAHVETYLEEFCRREGLIFISARATLEALAREGPIAYPLDGHYMDNANTVMASAVAPVLRAHLFSQEPR